jgi:uncharacterized protein (TIGR03086 family)
VWIVIGSDDPLGLLQRALDQTGTLIQGVRPDQANLPTPCSSWDVDQLVRHIVRDARSFAARVRGAQPQDDGEGTSLSDQAGAYRASAADLLEAWHEMGTDRMIQLPFGEVPATWSVEQQIANFAVHGWDLARATGQSTDLDEAVGLAAIDFGTNNLKAEFRGDEGSGKAFGHEVRVPADAPLYDRLAGVFGRDPESKPGSPAR